MTTTKTYIAVACACLLAACGGGEDVDSSTETDAEAAEATDDAAAADDGGTTEYLVDETGEFSEAVGEEAGGNIRDRLTTAREAGNDIRILMVGSDSGETDSEASRALSESGGDVMIYINVGEEDIAVVGENIDAGEGDGTARSIEMAFDNGNFENGIMNAIMAIEMHRED